MQNKIELKANFINIYLKKKIKNSNLNIKSID